MRPGSARIPSPRETTPTSTPVARTGGALTSFWTVLQTCSDGGSKLPSLPHLPQELYFPLGRVSMPTECSYPGGDSPINIDPLCGHLLDGDLCWGGGLPRHGTNLTSIFMPPSQERYPKQGWPPPLTLPSLRGVLGPSSDMPIPSSPVLG